MEYKLFLGRAYQESNQTNLAVDLYEDAIDDGNNAWARYYLSDAYRAQGKSDKAMETWNDLIKEVPNTTVSSRVQIMAK